MAPQGGLSVNDTTGGRRAEAAPAEKAPFLSKDANVRALGALLLAVGIVALGILFADTAGHDVIMDLTYDSDLKEYVHVSKSKVDAYKATVIVASSVLMVPGFLMVLAGSPMAQSTEKEE